MILDQREIRMSNQRKGKYQSRPDVIGQDMNILKFFKTAQKVLERENKQDEAFNYFIFIIFHIIFLTLL